MTVAEMIQHLRELPQAAPVWTYGIGINGHAELSLAQPPTVSTPYANGLARVTIDGGCV